MQSLTELADEALKRPEIVAGIDRTNRDSDYFRTFVLSKSNDVRAAAKREQATVDGIHERLSEVESRLRSQAGEAPGSAQAAGGSIGSTLALWLDGIRIPAYTVTAVLILIGVSLSVLGLALQDFASSLGLPPKSWPTIGGIFFLVGLATGATVAAAKIKSNSISLASRSRAEEEERAKKTYSDEINSRVAADSDVRQLKGQLERAQRRLRRALLEKGILEILRDELNKSFIDSYSKQLLIERSSGLSESVNLEYQVPTKAAERLDRLIASVSTGRFGIAGPRGVGKTTLITSFCEGQYKKDRWAFAVSAPVQYESRDFILHLFERLCEHVAGSDQRAEVEIRRSSPPWRKSEESSLAIAQVGGLLLAVAGSTSVTIALLGTTTTSLPRYLWSAWLLLLGVWLMWNTADRNADVLPNLRSPYQPSDDDSRNYQSVTSAINTAAGVVLFLQGLAVPILVFADVTLDKPVLPGLSAVVLGIVSAVVSHQAQRRARYVRIRQLEFEEERSRRGEDHLAASNIEARAKVLLREIRWQQAYTTGWSGALKFPTVLGGPISIEATETGGSTITSKTKTFPDVVESFRNFAEDVATDRPLLIAIDELDKLESAEQARKFVNDIKAIFGIRNTHYLVSVSEDALSNFERRGMPFRDVFDSAFDEILSLPYLSLAEAKHLLRRRLVGVPVPFVCLCYCLSGGLPRDLIRAARNVVDLGKQGTSISLRQVTEAIVAEELASKTHGVASAMKNADIEPESTELLGWLQVVQKERIAAIRPLLRRRWFEDEHMFRLTTPARFGASGDVQRVLIRLARELAGFYYYACTIEEVFTDDLDVERLRQAERPEGPLSLERLAQARQAFSDNSVIAWDAVTRFREAWGLEVADLPPVLR